MRVMLPENILRKSTLFLTARDKKIGPCREITSPNQVYWKDTEGADWGRLNVVVCPSCAGGRWQNFSSLTTSSHL